MLASDMQMFHLVNRTQGRLRFGKPNDVTLPYRHTINVRLSPANAVAKSSTHYQASSGTCFSVT
jgi:hypothetical protein